MKINYDKKQDVQSEHNRKYRELLGDVEHLAKDSGTPRYWYSQGADGQAYYLKMIGLRSWEGWPVVNRRYFTGLFDRSGNGALERAEFVNDLSSKGRAPESQSLGHLLEHRDSLLDVEESLNTFATTLNEVMADGEEIAFDVMGSDALIERVGEPYAAYQGEDIRYYALTQALWQMPVSATGKTYEELLFMSSAELAGVIADNGGYDLAKAMYDSVKAESEQRKYCAQNPSVEFCKSLERFERW